MWARLTWCRRKSRRIVCGALIFTDFSTYSEQVALKSSLAALERDGRTRRWSIAVISCETSAHLHSNHAWITLHGKGGSHTTHLQRKTTFPSALTVAQMGGWVRWSESCLFDPFPAHKILTNASAHFNKPKQSPGLSCQGSRKRNKSYGIFPSTWYLTASLTRCCCVHVVQPTAPVRCALFSA